MVWLPHWWDFSSSRTPTMPEAPRRLASSCMRVMASSRASYSAWVKLGSSTFWPAEPNVWPSPRWAMW